jgi:hypothetical protein
MDNIASLEDNYRIWEKRLLMPTFIFIIRNDPGIFAIRLLVYIFLYCRPLGSHRNYSKPI